MPPVILRPALSKRTFNDQNDETRDCVLNFIVHVLLEKFPRDIKELCLKYIDATHEETWKNEPNK